MNPNDHCISHLQAGGLVLTRDRRQARVLRRLHERAQVAAGRQAWPSAQVLPVEAWLAQQWREAAAGRDDLPELLQPLQAEWTWRLQVGDTAPGLLDAAELAAAARSSWLRLRAWGAEAATLDDFPLTADQRAFRQWAAATGRELQSRGLADAGDLPRLAVDLQVLPSAGPPLLFAGWLRMTPAQERMVDALAGQGRTVETLAMDSRSARAWRHAASEPDGELQAMLGWLRMAVDANPHGLHAAIVPDLGSRRAAVERAAAAILQPGLEMPGGADQERLFDLAGGTPLGEWPVVAAAFDLLESAGPQPEFAALSRLFRSPYIVGAKTEQVQRAQLDLQLRRQLAATRIPRAFAVAEARKAGAPLLAGALDAAGALLTGKGRLDSAGAWAEALGQLLGCWGWPAAGQLASSEFQAAQAFAEALRSLARFDRVTPPMPEAQALAHLRRLAQAPFQPERGEPSVFLLDALDVPGFGLDSLWVGGLTAAAWPKPVASDPFLPIELQRRLGMPCSSAESAVAEARAVTAAWSASCGALVCSWPRRDNDADVEGTAILPAGLAELPIPTVARRERQWFAALTLETLASDAAPAIGGEPARGGARILELQSACPFRAFAELRLAAEPMPELQPGLLPQVRGRVLHRALESFWLQTTGSAALAALAPDALESRVAACVDEALAGELPAVGGARSRRLERDWQLAAVRSLLAQEQDRRPFEVVAAERDLRAEIGGLALRMRVDRVDRIGEQLVVIDYKTGKCSLTHWRGARPEAPQLPLYAVLQPGPVAGVALAEIGAGGARYLGVAEDASLIGGLSEPGKFELYEDRRKAESWRQVTQHWYAWLEALARQYASGHAEVDPKQPATCRNCHLDALCRVGAGSDDEQEADDES